MPPAISLFHRAWLLLALLLSAACSSLPPVTAQPAPARQAVKIETSRGVMSSQQSQAVLERMEDKSQDTGIFERHLALEQAVSGSPLVAGNRVVLYADGPSTYEAMFKAIAGAKRSINMETYILEDDEVGRKFAYALIDKRKQGLAVNLVYDSVGCLATPRAFFDHLRDNGVGVVEFNPVNPLNAKKGWELNSRDHRKLLVIDGRTAFLGGINISGVYASGSSRRGSAPVQDADGKPRLPWRDTHMQIEGPVVTEFQKLFLDTWKRQKGEPLVEELYLPPVAAAGKEVVRALASTAEDGTAKVYTTLLSAINSAETSILLTNAYFAPDDQFLDALTAAARRGVDVKLILPGQTDSQLIFHAGRSYYSRLLKDGVKVYERKEMLLHAKTAIIDGVWSSVGSTNLDWRSFLHNDEINAVILGNEFGAQLKAMFDRDLAASTEITAERWAKRGLLPRLKERAARIWAYWL